MPIAPVTAPQTDFKKLLVLIDIYLLQHDISNKQVEIIITDCNIIDKFNSLSTPEKVEIITCYQNINWLVVYSRDGALTFNKILYKGR